MPKGSNWLIPKPVALVFGKPLSVQEYQAMSDDQIVESIASSLEDLFGKGKNGIERLH
jgi:hypothetical protein